VAIPLRSRGREPKRLLEAGDVIRTNPRKVRWGCAIALTQRDKTPRLDPMCHVAVLTSVWREPFELVDLADFDLLVGASDVEIRVGVNKYRDHRRSYWIGIYSRKVGPAVVVLGTIAPRSVWPDDLTFDVGDGSNGGWPMCGTIKPSLGYEAVTAWRKAHDTDNWSVERDQARQDHEEMLLRPKKPR